MHRREEAGPGLWVPAQVAPATANIPTTLRSLEGGVPGSVTQEGGSSKSFACVCQCVVCDVWCACVCVVYCVWWPGMGG